MPFDYSGNPLAQAFISEGRARGYNPFAISAILGNSQQENNLQAGGTPGDGGVSYGGMQWNNDRLANLQRFAQQQGTSWDDPVTQAKFYYNELDGPEKQWGNALRNAGNIQDATNAAISTLRPRGWTADNPQAGDAYNRRLQYAQNAYDALGNGSAGAGGAVYADKGIGGTGSPTGNILAYAGGASDANNDPGTSAIAAAFGKPGSQVSQPAQQALDRDTAAISVPGFQGTFTRKQAEDAAEDDASTPGTDVWDQAFDALPKNDQGQTVSPTGGSTPSSASGGALSTNNAIGPGILGWLNSDKATGFGNSLTRLGAALMARDNPSGSAALLSTLPNANQALNAAYTQAQINHLKSLDNSDDSKDQTANHVKLNPDGTSTITHIDKNGNPSIKTVGTPTAGYEKPPVSAVQKTFQDNDLQFGNAVNTINLANSVRDRIINKNIPLTFAQGVWNVAKNYTGNADDASALSKDAETLVKQYAGIRAQAEHMRAAVALKQAEDQIAPQGAQYDQRLMLGAMQKMIDYMHNVGQTSLEANNRTVKQYPQWSGDRSRFQPAWDSVEMDNDKYGKQADAWIKNRSAAQNAPAAGGAPSFGQWRTKGQPAPQPSPVAPLPSPLPPSPLQPNPTAATVGGSVIPQ